MKRPSLLLLLFAEIVETQQPILFVRIVLGRIEYFRLLAREQPVREGSGTVLRPGLKILRKKTIFRLELL